MLSAPVNDALTNEYVGMVDVVDLIGNFLQSIFPELQHVDFIQDHKRLSIAELQALGVEFGTRTITRMLHGGDLWYKVR